MNKSCKDALVFWLFLAIWVHLDYMNTALYFKYWSEKLLHSEYTLSQIPNRAVQWQDFCEYVPLNEYTLFPYMNVLGCSELIFYIQLILSSVLYIILPLFLRIINAPHTHEIMRYSEILFLISLGLLFCLYLYLNPLNAGVFPIIIFYPVYYISIILFRVFQYIRLGQTR